MAAPVGDGSLEQGLAVVNISCFDLLLIELVPLAERMARSFEESLDRPKQSAAAPAGAAVVGPAAVTPATAITTAAGAGNDGPTDLFRDSVYVRLERLGFRVGEGLSELFSRDRPRFVDHLDVIKFLCKDLWTVVFKKQIDNLKTNHRGVFVLTDHKFRPLSRMSMASHAEAIARAQPHLYFPCGIIRGVLASLGIKATVQAESTELPTATFQIKTMAAKT